MRPGVTIALTAVDRRRLGAIVGNRNVPQKHVWRAEIVLLSAGGLGTVEIMRRTGKSKTCVWRWQERFAEEGVDGLLRDKTRHPKVQRWLDRHERFTFHFTPTSCSWLNAIEGFFAKLTKRRLKRGVFVSVVDLQAAINRFVVEHNTKLKPFTWTADPDKNPRR